MCVGIEYFLDGEAVTVYFDSDRPDRPVRIRGGKIAFYRWGARGGIYTDDNTPGWLQKFPEGGHASLESIRAERWINYEPRPVRILASRFFQINSMRIPCYFALKRGEFIQGLIATITSHKRLYVVPAPAEHAHDWQEWPRIVRRATSAG
jgi:hypothetical protein